MRNFKMVLIGLLMSLTTTFAGQTFEHTTAYQSKYYFFVPTKLTIVESGEPTDCYLSYSTDSLNWKRVSPIYQWGLGNIYTINWTPDTVFTSGYLGLHTAPRNTKDFSFDPTDVTDTLIDVVFANAQFINPITEYWAYDEFEFTFTYEKNTLPSTIQFQYSYDETTWFDYKNIQIDNSGKQSFKVVNEYYKDRPVKFRLTYNHRFGQKHNIAITDWVKYSPSSLKILNKGYLERGVWNDKTLLQLKFQKLHLSNLFFHDVIVTAVIGTDTITFEKLLANDDDFTFNVLNYTLTNDYTGKVKLLFYTSWGELLNTITLTYLDKYLTVGTLPMYVQPLQPIYLLWSNSENFTKVLIEESYNGSEFYKVQESWNIASTPYPTSLLKEGEYKFRITASDEFETLSSTTNSFFVESGFCDSLELEIERLNLVIDSLSSIDKDSLIIVILKDRENNSVISEVGFRAKDVRTLNVDNSLLNLTSRELIKEFFVSDYIGNVVVQSKVENYTFSVDVSSYLTGYYFLIVLTDDNSIKIYKFLK